MIFHNKKCKAFPGREEVLPKGLLEYHCFYSSQQLGTTLKSFLWVFLDSFESKFGKNSKIPLSFPFFCFSLLMRIIVSNF